MKNNELRIVKHKRSYLIVAGKAELFKCRCLAAAKETLGSKRSFLEYWAGSAGVSIQNSEWIEIEI